MGEFSFLFFLKYELVLLKSQQWMNAPSQQSVERDGMAFLPWVNLANLCLK